MKNVIITGVPEKLLFLILPELDCFVTYDRISPKSNGKYISECDEKEKHSVF